MTRQKCINTVKNISAQKILCFNNIREDKFEAAAATMALLEFKHLTKGKKTNDDEKDGNIRRVASEAVIVPGCASNN